MFSCCDPTMQAGATSELKYLQVIGSKWREGAGFMSDPHKQNMNYGAILEGCCEDKRLKPILGLIRFFLSVYSVCLQLHLATV